MPLFRIALTTSKICKKEAREARGSGASYLVEPEALLSWVVRLEGFFKTSYLARLGNSQVLNIACWVDATDTTDQCNWMHIAELGKLERLLRNLSMLEIIRSTVCIL